MRSSCMTKGANGIKPRAASDPSASFLPNVANIVLREEALVVSGSD
jgi:hypothetical protein